jgi:hypothetical protein
MLYSNDEICVFVTEKRIPICVFPLTGDFYCDPKGYDFKLTFDDVGIIHDTMNVISQNMNQLKEWLEDF